MRPHSVATKTDIPFVVETMLAYAVHAHREHATGDELEAGCESDDIKFVKARLDPYTLRGDFGPGSDLTSMSFMLDWLYTFKYVLSRDGRFIRRREAL